MVYGQRTRTKRYNRTRRYTKRYSRKPPMRKRYTKNLYSFKTHYKQVFQIKNGVTGAGLSFELDDLPNAGEFTALFDRFRLLRVKAKFIFDANTTTLSVPNNAAAMPNLYWVIDPNDSTAIGTVDGMMEYQNVQVKRLDRPITIYFKPTLNNTLPTGTSNSIGNPWLSTATAHAASYYGLKFITDASMEGGDGSANVGHMTVILTYYMQFANPV